MMKSGIFASRNIKDIQSALCFISALFLGMDASLRLLLALVVLLPAAAFFVGIGLLAGSVFNDKQVAGVCGALLTNLSALLSGALFDVRMIGGTIETIAYLLPFAHAVDAAKAAISGDYASILPHLLWVIGSLLLQGRIAMLQIFSGSIKLRKEYGIIVIYLKWVVFELKQLC